MANRRVTRLSSGSIAPVLYAPSPQYSSNRLIDANKTKTWSQAINFPNSEGYIRHESSIQVKKSIRVLLTNINPDVDGPKIYQSQPITLKQPKKVQPLHDLPPSYQEPEGDEETEFVDVSSLNRSPLEFVKRIENAGLIVSNHLIFSGKTLDKISKKAFECSIQGRTNHHAQAEIVYRSEEMRKRGIFLPFGWTVVRVQTMKFIGHFYVSPEGKRFLSFKKVLCYLNDLNIYLPRAARKFPCGMRNTKVKLNAKIVLRVTDGSQSRQSQCIKQIHEIYKELQIIQVNSTQRCIPSIRDIRSARKYRNKKKRILLKK
ncbi:uncharacterized protein [Lepeophtheirus salmonis]|uniref:uncharacterized protein n=1 Tax=Lepeophtheirus salmonis TaxID=72036 RepID=UPI003AF3DB1C